MGIFMPIFKDSHILKEMISYENDTKINLIYLEEKYIEYKRLRICSKYGTG